ncbi:MAG: hypothetical protein FJX22_04035 [Alphaproteobacteria bacterium]|nr:hypothetical protein [Alphaproteobacteria bacterium]
MLTQPYFDRFYDWVVRPVQSDADQRRVHEIAQDNFGANTFPLEHIGQWHQNYPEGRRLLCAGELVVGYVSIWPIVPDQAQQFCQGELMESQLTPMSIQQVRQQGATHWYIGAVVIESSLRKPIKGNPIGFLLAMALNSWAETSGVQYPVTVFSPAYSPEGERLLRRFGFDLVRNGNEMPDGDPLYQRTATDKNALFQSFAQHGIPQLF